MRTTICSTLLSLAMLSAAASPPDLPGKAADLSALRSDNDARAIVRTESNLQPGPYADATARFSAFVARNRHVVGLAESEMRLNRHLYDTRGGQALHYQQSYRGLPVIGGWLVAGVAPNGALRSVTGNLVPDLSIDAVPQVTKRKARAVATAIVAAQHPALPVSVAESRLVIYKHPNPRLRQAPPVLAWMIELQAAPGVRETVVINAHTGKTADQFSRVHDLLDRRIYNVDYGPAFQVWGEGDPIPAPGQVADLVTFTEDTYNLYAYLSNGNFLSWNGNSAPLDAIANSGDISCPNANWNGSYTNFCLGTTSDDVVAHEWAHAYTQSTHDLIYRWQSGALNESYSDIFGEVVDLLNGQGTDAPADIRTVGQCAAANVRWLIGEDAFAFNNVLRDMWHPPCRNDPGKVSDGQYFCGDGDSGGVHTNSGVPNHAFALLVDGGTYNGITVNGIGLDKAAHLYWHASTTYQGPTSGFPEHADALEMACADLLNQQLPALGTATGDLGLTSAVTAADCNAVAATVAATELRSEPLQCNYQTLLAQDPPPRCAVGEAIAVNHAYDFEQGWAGWTVGRRDILQPATFDGPDWSLSSQLPESRPGTAAYGPNLVLGNCALDNEAGVIYLQSPSITLASGANISRISFQHSLATETFYDGGNISVSVNGGSYTLLPGSAFLYNAYSGLLHQSDNPLAGQPAFHGSDQGSLSSEWGESQIDLSGLASPGDTISLRFELGMDGCNGAVGWFVDDVEVYQCEVIDTDNDNIADLDDNCTLVANADQRDTNNDGFGNACDADFNNDGYVTALDLLLMKFAFRTSPGHPGWDADIDINGDGLISALDLLRLKQMFRQPPGPAGLLPE